MKQTLEPVLSKTLKPICPRDNHQMRYEANGIQWKTPLEDHVQTMAAYHCDFAGCNVGYDHMNGYFSVVNAPERPFRVEEPSTNPQCARHGTWLYRCDDEQGDSGFAWRCGVEGCDYVHADVGGL